MPLQSHAMLTVVALCALFLIQLPVAVSAQVPDKNVTLSASDASHDEAWWTGAVAASSAYTLPRGHLLFEPYLFDVRSRQSDYLGSLTYILYGVTDRLTVGGIATFGSIGSKTGRRRGRMAVNDLTLSAQYRLYSASVGALVPTASIVVQHVLPLGRFDQLAGEPERGIGSGSNGTLIGLYLQRSDRLANGRLLRTRVNLTHTWPTTSDVRGASIFGTDDGFHGRAHVGAVTVADLSVEYSITRSWVFATDLIYRHAAATSINGLDEMEGRSEAVAKRFASTQSISFAPAVEYSWNANRGVLAGVRVTPAWGGATATWTPVIAFNAVF
jgi:hypothetical protein